MASTRSVVLRSAAPSAALLTALTLGGCRASDPPPPLPGADAAAEPSPGRGADGSADRARPVGPDAGDEAPIEGSRGGTRLKALYGASADGQKAFLHYLDTELQLRCAFAVAADGATRCLPLVPEPRFFADEACTVPALPADEACARAYVTRGVGERRHVFRVQETAAPALFVPGAGGTCGAAPDIANARAFRTATPVPPATFVQVDEPRPQPVPGRRIVPLVRRAADGTIDWVGLWDTRLGVRCGAEIAADGAYRCLPYWWTSTTATTFADPECKQPLLVNRDAVFAPPYFAKSYDATVCPRRATMYRTEPRADVTAVYRRDPRGACQAGTPEPGARYLTMGAAIQPAELDRFSPVESAARVSARVMVTADGAKDFLWGMWDKQFSEPCDWNHASDGVLRCLPRLAADNLYADAACGTRAAAPPQSTTTCDRPPPAHAAIPEGPWCARGVRLYRLEAAATATFRTDAFGVCAPVNVTGLRAVGAPLDPATFVAGTELRE